MYVEVRFYADLLDLAEVGRDGVARVPYGRPRSVKDLIESLGVPHPEVDLLLVNGETVDFAHLVQAGDRVAAFPRFTSIDVGPVSAVRPPSPAPRFLLDVHLGTLTRRLRVLGFDAWYRSHANDAELAAIASREGRILLTRDRGLLMRTVVTHGYCPRSDLPEMQALEVVRRYDLSEAMAPFTRCVNCNGRLVPAAKADVIEALPPRTRVEHDTFTRCQGCRQVYWPGSHKDRITDFVTAARYAGRRGTPDRV